MEPLQVLPAIRCYQSKNLQKYKCNHAWYFISDLFQDFFFFGLNFGLALQQFLKMRLATTRQHIQTSMTQYIKKQKIVPPSEPKKSSAQYLVKMIQMAVVWVYNGVRLRNTCCVCLALVKIMTIAKDLYWCNQPPPRTFQTRRDIMLFK